MGRATYRLARTFHLIWNKSLKTGTPEGAGRNLLEPGQFSYCASAGQFFGHTVRSRSLMENLLKVRELTIRYRSAELTEREAVQGVSFDVAPGEVLGVMGESGCGKTSIALALLGLLSKEHVDVSGSIMFRDEDVLTMKERSLRKIRGTGISMVHQEPGIVLSPVMRVGMQIAEVAHAHKQWNWEKCRAEAHAMLARVKLNPTDRIFLAYPHQLSGGQLQRVVLAQALICRPALVIADEPTASLDARSQSDFIALLRELKQGLGISLLLISHTPEIQASLADRIIVMKDGAIVEGGGFDRMYWSPIHPYTRTLLRRDRPAAEEKPERERRAQEYVAR
jgi:ABC-type glutathione transport system ATPase component